MRSLLSSKLLSIFFAIAIFRPGKVIQATEKVSTPNKNLPWVTEKSNAPGVFYRTFESKIVGAKVSYHVYLPDEYGKAEGRFPVLYWLHGTKGGISGIPPLTNIFREAITSKQVPAMLIVFVNGLSRRLWADSKDGSSPVEKVFLDEVISDVDKEFRTIAERKGRILEGFSMGGYGAGRIGLKRPDLFAGISFLAGGPLDLEFQGPKAQQNPRLRRQILQDVCGNDLGYFQSISPWLIAESNRKALTEQEIVIRQVVGLLDETLNLNRRFHMRLSDLNISHQYIELPNVGHNAQTLIKSLGSRNGEFYRRALSVAR
jgi:enterochelin esterase-like enzyme